MQLIKCDVTFFDSCISWTIRRMYSPGDTAVIKLISIQEDIIGLFFVKQCLFNKIINVQNI